MSEMQIINVSSIEAGQYFTAPLYLDDRYILLSPETPISEELLNRLAEWKYTTVRTEGEATDTAGTSSAADGAAIEQAVEDEEVRKEVHQLYQRLAEFTQKLFTNYVSSGDLSYQKITDELKEVNEIVRRRRHHVTRVGDIPNNSQNYIVMHSVKTTILSLAVGLYMRLPPHKLLELGTAALLHEIGMIRLPSKLYLSDQKLSDAEKKAITAHPVLGFRILRSHSFPMPICLGVLESHERVDGQGYPRGISGDRISQYARIIFVCDSFSAQVSKRPFREARDGHASLLDMLKDRGTAYDEQILRVLIQLVSVYPVGTYVEMEDGAQGIVVDTNENDPRAPLVRLLKDAKGVKSDSLPTIRTDEEGHRITRGLSQNEREALSQPHGG